MDNLKHGPAYRIETQRLVIRCWNPIDAPLLKLSVDESRQHLAPWIPWVQEDPSSLDEQIKRLRRYRAEFDLDQDFVYGIFNLAEDEVRGGTGLHTRRGKDIREIGYWIHKDHTHQGLATEATQALVKVAFEIDCVQRVEIRCDPSNLASSAIPIKLGFSRKGLLQGDPEFPGANLDTEIWNLKMNDYPHSSSFSAQFVAFDALLRPIPLKSPE